MVETRFVILAIDGRQLCDLWAFSLLFLLSLSPVQLLVILHAHRHLDGKRGPLAQFALEAYRATQHLDDLATDAESQAHALMDFGEPHFRLNEWLKHLFLQVARYSRAIVGDAEFEHVGFVGLCCWPGRVVGGGSRW